MLSPWPSGPLYKTQGALTASQDHVSACWVEHSHPFSCSFLITCTVTDEMCMTVCWSEACSTSSMLCMKWAPPTSPHHVTTPCHHSCHRTTSPHHVTTPCHHTTSPHMSPHHVTTPRHYTTSPHHVTTSRHHAMSPRCLVSCQGSLNWKELVKVMILRLRYWMTLLHTRC